MAAALLGLAAFAPVGRAQQGLGPFQPPPAALFDPTEVVGPDLVHHVPLSEFKSTFSSGNPVVLHVKSEILDWLDDPANNPGGAGDVRVAVNLPGGVGYLPHSALTIVNDTGSGTGTISFAPSLQGNVVAVSSLFENELPVVTHWDDAANGGRGGQSTGASGALLDGSTSLFSSGPTYVFDGTSHALFSDGSGLFDDDLVPEPEKYIGENYSLYEITDLAAVNLSDLHRAATGWPIAHRNYDSEADEVGLFAAKLDEDLPLFQILHAYIVPFEDPAVAGKEESLATFVLPPGYPIVFLGFYDVHASTFGYDLGHLEALGDLANEGYSAVGIFWNGGGAEACQTMHMSAHDNAEMLLTEKAPLLVDADPDRLLITGGSRGGTTGLEIASTLPLSPSAELYVISANPQLAHGETIRDFTDSTHPLIQDGVLEETGYKDGWLEGWTDPVHGVSGRVLAAHNFTGVPIPDTPENVFDAIDAAYSPIAEPMVQGLAANRTKLILRAATHDYSRPMSLTAEYVDALRSNEDVFGNPDPVDVRLELSYRFGHGNALGLPGQPDELTILRQLCGGPVTYVHQDENVFYRRVDNVDYDTAEEFSPSFQPLVLEMPLATPRNDAPNVTPPTWTVTGEPGTVFGIWLEQVDDGYWNGAPLTVLPGDPIFIGSEVLPSTPATAELTSVVLRPDLVSLPIAPGNWTSFRVTVYFLVNGVAPLYQVSTGAQAAPSFGNETVLRVFRPIPVPAFGAADQTRCGGLAADALFP